MLTSKNLKVKAAKSDALVGTKFENCPTFQSIELRHQKFLLNYLKHGNAGKAAREAGFSARTADQQASRLLRIVKVSKALSEVNAILQEADVATAKEVQQRLTRIARACITDVCSWNKDGLVFTANSDELDRDTASLIKRIRVTEKVSQKGDWTETRTEIELHDVMDALDKLARIHGLYKDKVEITGKSYEERLRERIEERKAQGKSISPW